MSEPGGGRAFEPVPANEERRPKLLRSLLIVFLIAAISCAAAAPQPAQLDTKNEPCRFCRMTVSDQHFASQIIAPGEEPVFFDDLGCLANFLKSTNGGPKSAAIFVADHRDAEWIPAGSAIYSRCTAVDTPMGSHIIAHRDAASRQSDPAAANCEQTTFAELTRKSGP